MNNYIESLNIGENVFVLTEDSTLECLIHFAAPFTGSVSVVIPKGTCCTNFRYGVKAKAFHH